MASESSVTDQSIDEHAEKEKVGDDTKYDGEEIIFLPKEVAEKDEADNNNEEGVRGTAPCASDPEEKHEPDVVSVADEARNEERHEKVGEVKNSLHESEVSNSSELGVETNEENMQSPADVAREMPSEVQEKSIDFVETSATQDPVISESKTDDSKDAEVKPTSENERKLVEASFVSTGISEDGNVEAEILEAANPESSKDKVDIKLVKPEDSEDGIQELVPAEIPTVVVPDASDAPEKNDVDSSNPTNIEVPVKDLQVESGSPEEQKPKESTETEEPSSNVSTIDTGGEVVGSSSYEEKPSGVAEVVEKRDDGLEVETIQTLVTIHKHLEAKPELAQTQSVENVSEEVEVKKNDEIVEGGIETSTVPDDVPPLAKVSSEEENASGPGEVVEEKKDETSLEGDSIDIMPEVAEVSLEGDKLVDKEKVVNVEAVERDLVYTSTDPTEAEVSFEQVKAPETIEIVKEESEASEGPSEGDKVSAGDEEKSESWKGGDAASVEAPKEITYIEESLDQLVEEKKSESSKGEIAAPADDELADKEKNENVEAEERDLVNTSTDPTATKDFSEQVKAPEIVEESDKQALEVTSKELNIAPEASEVSSECDKLLVDDEKSESLEGEAATSTEAPKDITTVAKSLDQVIEEKKSESSMSESEALVKDKLIDKAKDVNVEAKEKDLVDISTDLTATEISSEQVKASETAEIVKEESDKETLISIEDFNIARKASEVPPEDDRDSAGDEEKSESLKGEDATLVEAPKDITTVEDSLDQVIEENSESSKVETEALAEDKLVDKEKDVDVEAEERDLVGTSTDPIAAKVYSEQVKDPEIAEILKEESNKEALKVTSKELNIASEASEVPSEGDKVFVDDGEKSESLIGGDAASNEAPKEITSVKESLNQMIEENKNESSISETEAPTETTKDSDTSDLSPEAVKEILASKTVEEKKDETSKDLNVEEKKANDLEDNKEEVKVEGALQNATDKPAQVELGAEKEESEKSKDQDPIVSSDAGDAKLIKEMTKHESNIFSKHVEEEKVGDDTKYDGEEIIFQRNEAAGKDEADNNNAEGMRGTASSARVSDERHEPVDVSVADETKKEERNAKVGEVKNSLHESELSNSSEPAVETNEENMQSQAGVAGETPSEVQEKSSIFVETSASQEPVISESKVEDLKDAEVEPTSENESKLEEAPFVSTGLDISEDGNVEAETQEVANPESSKDKVDIKLIKLEDSEDEIQELVPADIPTVVLPDASEAPEKNDVDSSNTTSIEVPVKDLEVESGFPEEQKPEKVSETEEPSSNVFTIDGGGEEVRSSSYEAKPSGVAEVIEKKDEGLHEDLEAKTELAQTQSDENISDGVEVKKDDEIVEGGIETSTALDDVTLLAKVSSEEEKASEPGGVVEEKDETSLEGDSIDTVPKVAEVSLEGGNVLEGDKLVDKEKVVKAEAVERDLVDTSTDPTEAEVSFEKAPETTEILKESDTEALEVTPKELNNATEACEVSSEGDTISAGDEKSESLKGGDATSVETPKDITVTEESLDPLVEEKNSESSKSEIEAPAKGKLVDKEKDVNVDAEERILVRTSTYPNATEVSSDKVKAPEISKEESDKALGVTSKELNITSDASEVPFEGDKLFAGDKKSESLKDEAATLVEAPKDITTTKESLDQVIEEKSESSKSETEALVEDKLVDKEKDVNVETIQRDSVDKFTDPTAAEVSFEQVKAPNNDEIVNESEKETLEVLSKELNIAPEASEVPSKGDKVSTGDEEKSESLKGEDATSVEATKDITTAEESHDQVIVEKSESLQSEIEALAEDKLVDKEKDVNVEAEERDFVNTSTDPTTAEAFFELIKNPETAEIVKEESDKEALKVTSKEVHIASEASEVPSKSDQVSTGDEEKSESLKDGDTISVEAPKDITTAEETLNQAIEENRIESSKSEIEAPSETTKDSDTSELSPDAVKDIIASESADAKKNETSEDLSMEEKKAPEDKKEEVKVVGALLNATDLPEQVELGAEKEESEKSKGQDLIVSSDAGAAKLIKEVTKRESNIFSKHAEEKIVGGDTKCDGEEIIFQPKEGAGKDEADNCNEQGMRGTASTASISEYEPDGVSVADETKEEEQHEKVGEVKNSVLESEVYNSSAPAFETNEGNMQSKADGAHETPSEVQEKSSDLVETSTCQDPVVSELMSENKRKPEEAPLVSTGLDISEEGNVEADTKEAVNPKSSKDKVDIELIKSEDLVDEVQELVPAEIPTVVVPDASEALERDDSDSSSPTSIEVPVKDLEVESCSPEVQKAEVGTETNETSSNVITIDGGSEVVGSSSYEEKPSGVAEVVEKKDEGLEEETIKTSVKTHEDLEAKIEFAQTPSDEGKVSEGVEFKEDDEIVAGGMESSTVLDDLPPLANVSSGEEKTFEPGEVVEEDKTLEGDDIDTAPKVAEVSLEGGNFLKENKLVDKEKDVNVEAVEGVLVDTSTNPTAAEVSSKQIKVLEIAEITEESNKQALEVTSKEINIALEANEVTSEGDKISAGDGKSDNLKGEHVTSVDTPKEDITIANESLDQVIEEKKSESSKSETGTPTKDKLVDKEKDVNVEAVERDLVDTSTDLTAVEVSAEQVKAPEIAKVLKDESDKEALEVTSNEVNVAPKAGEITSEDDKVSAGVEEKSESLKDEDATSTEAPKDITIVEESLDQVIEVQKIESSKRETEALAKDKLVDKEYDVNVEAEERDLVGTSIYPASAEVSFEQVRDPETAEIVKEESNKEALKVTSKELNIGPEDSEVPSEGEVSAGDEKGESLKGGHVTSVVEPKDITTAEESLDQVIEEKKSESSESETEALAKDKLFFEEKDVNLEAEERGLVDTSTYPTAVEVSSEQIKASETSEIVKEESEKEVLEVTSKELDTIEASEVPSEGDKVSAGEEKSESLKGEDATSVEAPKDITKAKKSVDQVIEEKSESSKSETEVLAETTRDFDTSDLSPETVKDIIASETADEKKDGTSKDISVEEKKANDPEDKKDEMKVKGALQNARDKPEHEELGTEKEESYKSKDQDPIVSSDTVDAKLIKEVTKRQSNIFSKVKRSIVKAKKAILGKSPGPKTLSSEAKHRNT